MSAIDKLTIEEKQILNVMPDHRAVSKPLCDSFESGGLSAFRQFIIKHNKSAKASDKLVALLRGNNGHIIIYKNNHKIWEISASGTKNPVSTVKFDFNHARYTKEWKTILGHLTDDLDFKFTKDKAGHEKERCVNTFPAMAIKRNDNDAIIGGAIGYLSCKKESFDEAFVANTFKIITGLIDDFFNPNKSKDYFREQVEKEIGQKIIVSVVRGTVPNIEKRWQQRLFFQFKDLENGYYVYDLEFSQPFPTSELIKKYAKKNGERFAEVSTDSLKEKLTTNEPDMLAIRFGPRSKPEALVLIEVKSTASACVGDSGIKEHLQGMKEYADNPIFMKKRKDDCLACLKQFQKFGFIPDNISLEFDISKLPVEKVLLFTNDYYKEVTDSESEVDKENGCDSAIEVVSGAVEYYLSLAKKTTNELAKKYGSEIWITKNIYESEEIEIKKVDFE